MSLYRNFIFLISDLFIYFLYTLLTTSLCTLQRLLLECSAVFWNYAFLLSPSIPSCLFWRYHRFKRNMQSVFSRDVAVIDPLHVCGNAANLEYRTIRFFYRSRLAAFPQTCKRGLLQHVVWFSSFIHWCCNISSFLTTLSSVQRTNTYDCIKNREAILHFFFPVVLSCTSRRRAEHMQRTDDLKDRKLIKRMVY